MLSSSLQDQKRITHSKIKGCGKTLMQAQGTTLGPGKKVLSHWELKKHWEISTSNKTLESFHQGSSIDRYGVQGSRSFVDTALTLIKRSFGCTICIPASCSIIANRSHPCTEIGYNCRRSTCALPPSLLQQGCHVLCAPPLCNNILDEISILN
jgi:hypothetical protein